MIRARASLVLVALAFFASGAAALVYQVVWQRVLALHTGVGIYSVALIVAAFMAGLGLGAHLGGALSLRLTPARALAAFGLLELAIALFGAASLPVYYDFLYARAGALYDSPLLAGFLQFAALLPPTLLMGMSLPLLARATVLDAATAGRTIGVMYGVNTLGAAVGALAAPWFLMRHLGLSGAVLVAAGANALAGVTALVLWRAGAGAPEPAPSARPSLPGAAEPPGRYPLALWLALYAGSGFCALSLEILWFRLLEVTTRSTSFTFGTLLAIYLGCFALGCLAGALRAPRFVRPLRLFLLCQCVLVGYAGLAVLLLVELPRELPLVAPLQQYWSSGDMFVLGDQWNKALLVRLYLLLPLALFGLPTVLMGLSFPALQRAVQDEPASSGRKVGLLQAANIAGCVAGSLGVGLLGLSWFGTGGSLRLLTLGGVAFALVGVEAYGVRSVFSAAAAVLLGLALTLPSTDRLWVRLHGPGDSRTLIAEDATSVSGVVLFGAAGWRVTVNGKLHSSLPYGGVHTRLGATPAIVHPSPEEVAIVGLGSGDTAWAAGCRRETRRIVVFEIAGGQRRLLERMAAREELPQLRQLLADPRLRLEVADGRHALARRDARYDLIEADALWPYAAYSGHLYSVEFFRECASRLKPGGLMCSWAPTPRIVAAFRTVFPHVLMPRNRSFLIGGNDAIELQPETWHARASSPEIVRYLGAATAAELARYASRMIQLPEPYEEEVPPNRDLYPRDEFMAP